MDQPTQELQLVGARARLGAARSSWAVQPGLFRRRLNSGFDCRRRANRGSLDASRAMAEQLSARVALVIPSS